MNDNLMHEQAMVLFERAYRAQMDGELKDAIALYKRSLKLWPTAEAHTFLGWAYGMMSRYEDAIAECKRAIEIDPNYGNPYNDIGSYLMELGQYADALPWLEQAVDAERYDTRQYPYVNMGQAHEAEGRYKSALLAYDKALEMDPFYMPARWAKYDLISRLN